MLDKLSDNTDSTPLHFRVAPPEYLKVVKIEEVKWPVDQTALQAAQNAFADHLKEMVNPIGEEAVIPPVVIDGREWQVVSLIAREIFLATVLRHGAEYLMVDQECSSSMHVRFGAEAHGYSSVPTPGREPADATDLQQAAAIHELQMATATYKMMEFWS
ncbi:MAG TPA: hypothetical protein VFO38_03420 [Candidatus Saccharimonadales bacterium]|nr:hypothetical protein [Candidatus Saccharimonadales bacterium]